MKHPARPVGPAGPAPAWLADFQARFGAAIRHPLDRASGTLTAVPAAYDRELVAGVLDAADATGAARLAVYNRQYWFRLFEVLQSAFPLTARLTGYWDFNEVAARFLVARPPAGWDVDAVADGFDAFFVAECGGPRRDALADAAGGLRRDALADAARIDAAFRDVFRAPRTAPFRPSASDAARLLDGRLTLSPAILLVEERFPIVALRARVLSEPDAQITLPPPLDRPQRWAIHRGDEGTRTIALEPREADLIAALGRESVRGALAQIERACPPEERAALPESTRRWLARSVELGFFDGLRD
jgi:Putative DNA-binding domain